MQNHTASVVSMARATLMAMDRSARYQQIETATLALLIATLIDLAERDNLTARKIESAHAAFVGSKIAGIEQ